jgi:hypothetical protein
MRADVAISGTARRELRQAPATTPEAQKKSEWRHMHSLNCESGAMVAPQRFNRSRKSTVDWHAVACWVECRLSLGA